MKKIYKSGNYVIIEKGDGKVFEYPCMHSVYTFINDTYQIKEHLGGKTIISISEISSYFNLLGDTAYTEETLREFLRENTAFRTGGGNGSGVTQTLIGFIDYNDTTGSISLTANTWTDLPNNGLGAFTNKTYKPPYVTELMDVSTGYIDPTETYLGDTILIRNDYKVNPNTNNSLLEFRYVLGNGAGEYTLEKIIGRLDAGSGVDYRYNLSPDLIYMGDTNTQGNAIKLQVRLSTNGTLTNAGSVIKVLK